MPLFVCMTVLPYGLLSVAAIQGGIWVWLTLGFMTLFLATMDQVNTGAARNSLKDAEFPASTPLLVVLGLGHFALLALALWGATGPSGHSPIERLCLVFTAGLVFGQIGHPVAHELIHQSPRSLRKLGQCLYTSLMSGQHASAHLLVHHPHVGTSQDPNSAPKGEPFYRFLRRAGPAAFKAAYRAETNRLSRAGKSTWQNPFTLYVAGAILCLIVTVWVFGILGGVAYISMAYHAKLQIFLSDYVQHYGLRRVALPNGKPEPVGPQHSWNAPHLLSSALMVNAPRHSDHHVTPNRTYPALQLDRDTMPMLPYPLPVMGAIALIPRVWFRVMNPRCDQWNRTAQVSGKPSV